MRKTIEEKLTKLNYAHKIKIRVKKRLSSQKYYLDFTVNGKRQNIYLDYYVTGDYTKDDYILRLVDEIRKKKEVELMENKIGLTLNIQNKLFFDYCEHFLKEKKGANLLGYRYALLRFSRYLKRDKVLINEITESMIKGFYNHLQTTDLSPISCINYLNHIKIIFRQALRDRIISFDPCVNVKVHKPESVKVFLTVDEVKLLYETECVKPQVKNAFLFSCFTGLRWSDILNLKWSDIIDDRIHIVQKKTKSVVSVALADTSKAILKEQEAFRVSDNVFVLLEKKRTRNHLKGWVISAGIDKNVSFHTARHTFATMCLTSGIDIFTTSKLLGHSDIKTTQVYAKLIDAKRDEAIDKLPKL